MVGLPLRLLADATHVNVTNHQAVVCIQETTKLHLRPEVSSQLSECAGKSRVFCSSDQRARARICVDRCVTYTAAFLRDLERRPVPGLRGVAWFRLGCADDADAWSAPTLAAVMAGAPLEPQLAARLVPGPSGALDVVVENRGVVDATAPGRLRLRGELDALDGVAGYAPDGPSLHARAPPHLRAGARLTIGWVRGREVTLETH